MRTASTGKHDGHDIPDEWDQREQADEQPHRRHVGSCPHSRRTAPLRTPNDDRSREGTREPGRRASEGLRSVPDDGIADRGPGCCSDYGRNAGAHGVHAEEPGQDHAEAEAQAETEADRVPVSHRAQFRDAGNPGTANLRSLNKRPQEGGLHMARRTGLVLVLRSSGALLLGIARVVSAQPGKSKARADVERRTLTGYQEVPSTFDSRQAARSS